MAITLREDLSPEVMHKGLGEVAEALGQLRDPEETERILTLTREAISNAAGGAIDHPRLQRALCGLPADASDAALEAKRVEHGARMEELLRAKGLLQE